ncbi:MAG: M14 family metallopeptidase [Bacillota bacterium]
MTRPAITYDHYYRYDELASHLKALVEAYPQFLSMESIGKSFEGRDVWAVTMTNRATGPAELKPAMYVDGNIHAGEVTGSIACVYLIDHLVKSYETDPKARKLLDTRTFYVLPRVNPDGAELYLTTPTMLRSSVRIYPDWRHDENPPGLHAEDLDGDGDVLSMRIRDDARGAWKICADDPRLMVQRTPLDLEGPFYHIFSEGTLRDAKGQALEKVELPFQVAPTRYGLDLNRNFPAGYNPLTPGAGPYPLSEPETRNQVEFISKHKNIAGVLLYHTTGGVLFRPHSTIPDKDFAREDVAMYGHIGKLGTDATGYPVVCCYGDIWSGVLDDWCFEQLGLFAFTPELWDAVGRAAPDLDPKQLWNLSPEESQKVELKLLQWNDRELSGRGFVNWKKFNHPQFGEVEIGGWRLKEFRQNPPPEFLAAECHKITQFTTGYALSLPEVHIDEVHVAKVADDLFSLAVVVSNHGYLPTNVSKQALKQKVVRPDMLRLIPAQGMELINCEEQIEIGHLDGYSAGQQPSFFHFAPPANSVRRVRWTIKTSNAGSHTVTVKLISQRGGTEEREISLS